MEYLSEVGGSEQKMIITCTREFAQLFNKRHINYRNYKNGPSRRSEGRINIFRTEPE